jgi:5-methylcytosine-specific restriction endonuclease McrA
VSPLLRLCPQCGKANGRGDLAGLCPDCKRTDNQRRNAKRKTSGRTTAAWNRLRTAAILRDGCACRRCGRVGTVGTLTVHLRPELGGNHAAAALGDLTTLCRSCHGSIDAPRSHSRSAGASARSKAPSVG